MPFPPNPHNSLPNLMSGISAVLGGPVLPAPVPAGISTALKDRSRIVLLVIDGLGETQLRTHLAGGLISRHQVQTLDSVFPSTTASGVGTFLTGLAPISHGLTGWHIWCEEVNELLAILPLNRRSGGTRTQLEAEAWAHAILKSLDLPVPLALCRRLPCPVTHIAPAAIAHSPFNRHLAEGTRKLPYGDLPDLFSQLEAALEQPTGPHFIYAYWADYDSLAHTYGPDSPEAVGRLWAMEAALAQFLAKPRQDDTLLLITADHGFIDSPPERLLCLNDTPELHRLLLRPLSGERRAAFVHVQPGAVDEFVRLAREKLGYALWVERSQALLAHGWFGLGPKHPRLNSRIGDLTLIMKEDWTLWEAMPGEREQLMFGSHGGVSEAERKVPLCLFDLKKA